MVNWESHSCNNLSWRCREIVWFTLLIDWMLHNNWGDTNEIVLMVRIKFKQLKLLNSLETRLFWSGQWWWYYFQFSPKARFAHWLCVCQTHWNSSKEGFESRQCRVASGISIEGVRAKSKKSYNCGQLEFNKAWNDDIRYTRPKWRTILLDGACQNYIKPIVLTSKHRSWSQKHWSWVGILQ